MSVEVAAVAAVAGTLALAPVNNRDWVWFGFLLLAAVVHLEAARGMERVREIAAEGAPHTHLQSVWFFAAVLLLPPPLIVALLVVSYLHSWFRVYRRRALAHRKVFSVATVALGCLAAYGALALIYPRHYEPFSTVLDGPTGLAAVLIAAALYRGINFVLVLAVLLATNPDKPARNAVGAASDQLMLLGAIGLGSGIAVMMTTRPWWTPLLIVTVLALHMGLLMPQFRDASRTDAKTSLFDAVFWTKLVSDELARARRLGGGVGVLLLDLDHFKRINDSYGHLAGDAVLRAVADAIKRSVRGHDMVGRYGGEEFAVVLPGMGAADITLAAERVRAAIAGLEVIVRDLDGEERVITGLTASVGGAAYPEHGTDRTALLLAADAALYEAKDAGRNRTRVAGEVRHEPGERTQPDWLPTPRQPTTGRRAWS